VLLGLGVRIASFVSRLRVRAVFGLQGKESGVSEKRDLSGPTGSMGDLFPPCDQDCANCLEAVFVLNMVTFRQEWRCPNNVDVMGYGVDEAVGMTYQDFARICPDLSVSPYILALYEDYNCVVYRVRDSNGRVRVLETEFAVKRNLGGHRIAALGTTRLIEILEERPAPLAQPVSG